MPDREDTRLGPVTERKISAEEPKALKGRICKLTEAFFKEGGLGIKPGSHHPFDCIEDGAL